MSLAPRKRPRPCRRHDVAVCSLGLRNPLAAWQGAHAQEHAEGSACSPF